MIEIENLTVTYKDTPALDNINVTLSKSKIIGIVGPNGAGKSTLIKAVLNIIPSKGIIKIDNKLSKDQLGSVANDVTDEMVRLNWLTAFMPLPTIKHFIRTPGE